MNARRSDVEGGIGCHQLGFVSAHIQYTRHVEFKVGLAPGGVNTGLELRDCGRVIEFDALQAVIEVNRANLAAAGVHHQLMGVEFHGAGRGEVIQHQTVVAVATIDLGITRQRQADQVVALPRIDSVHAAVQANVVAAATTKDDVFTGTHIDDVAAFATNELVIAIAAVENQATALAADKFILARATANAAASSPTQNDKAVVAQATIKVEHRADSAADVDGVVALAAVSHNLFDRTGTVGLRLPQRTHRDVTAGLVNVKGFVGGIVVQVAAAIATRGVTHIQMQGTSAVQITDVRRSTPTPHVTARHGDAQHRDACRHVGTGWGNVDLGSKACQGDVNVKQAQVDFKVKRAPGCSSKTWPATKKHAHAGIQV